MAKPSGRPNGHLLHRQAFVAICAAHGLLKKAVADDADLSPQFLADLLYHRAGASKAVAARLAGAIGVEVEAIFPEFAGWIGPVPDRSNRAPKAAA